MADSTIDNLTAAVGTDLDDADLFLVLDGTNPPKKITRAELAKGLFSGGNLILGGEVVEAVHAWTSTSGAVTTELDPSKGTIQTLTLTGNITSLTNNIAAGESITLMIQDGTAYTITWPTMQWAGGSAPTLATTGYSVVVLWKVGATLYGSYVGDMS